MTTQPEALRLANWLDGNTNWPSFVPQDAATELRRLHEVTKRQEGEIHALEKFRPHWAMGYTSDSVAAQASTAALSNIWEILEARNQTEAVMKLRRLHEVNAELVGALTEITTCAEETPVKTYQRMETVARNALAKATGE